MICLCEYFLFNQIWVGGVSKPSFDLMFGLNESNSIRIVLALVQVERVGKTSLTNSFSIMIF